MFAKDNKRVADVTFPHIQTRGQDTQGNKHHKNKKNEHKEQQHEIYEFKRN